MKNSGEIILGGGIAGLIWAFYHPNATVITDKVGGQFSAPFQLGPKYLHKTPETEQFMKDLGENWNSQTVRVGFFYKGKVNATNTDENRKLYFRKTRGKSSEVYRSAMSGGDTEFEAYAIGVDELVKILEEKVKDRVVIDRISEIDFFEHHVEGEEKYYSFTSLVSTIPKPIYYKISGNIEKSLSFQSFPTTFVQIPFAPYPFHHRGDEFYNELGKEINYVYVSQPEFRFHRITKLPTSYVVECRGDDVPEFVNEMNRYVLKIGQLIEVEDDTVLPKEVKFFGRYATWKHNIKTQELLREIMQK